MPAGGESHDPNPLVAAVRDALNSMRRSIHGTFDSRRISGPRDRFTIIGDLTIHGVTREVTLQATFGRRMAGFTAETTINRKDFGLNWNATLETGGVLVGDRAKVAIEIEDVLQDPHARIRRAEPTTELEIRLHG